MWLLRRGMIVGRGALDASVASYTGPGDIVASAVGWWGLRAYTAASIGSNCVELRESGGNTTQTFVTIAGGGLDLAAIATFKGANNLFVRTLYDQTGNGHDFVQTTTANQPTFTLSGLGSLPIMSNTDTTKNLTVTLGSTISQPFTASCVARRASNFTTESYLGGTVNSGVVIWGYASTANNGLISSQTNRTATVSDSTWHGLQFVFNGASSDLNVDGSVNTVSPGTNSLPTGIGYLATTGQGGCIADMNEMGIWSSAFTGTQSTNMSSNQHSYWGF